MHWEKEHEKERLVLYQQMTEVSGSGERKPDAETGNRTKRRKI